MAKKAKLSKNSQLLLSECSCMSPRDEKRFETFTSYGRPAKSSANLTKHKKKK